MQVFYISANNGDGSTTVEFYDSKACVEYLTDEDGPNTDFERYVDGDGGSYGSFTVPDGTLITGVRIRSLSDIKK